MSTAQRLFTAVLNSGWLALWLGSSHWSAAADSLLWRQNENRVTAEISSWDLPTLLENVAAATGWQIYLEPDTKLSISTKFENRPPGDALRLLLGNLSFALLPQTNAPSQLLVFRTSRQEATQLVRPIAKRSDPTAKPIPNELVVKLKPGAKIDDLAKKLGAKVVGRADGLNAYRLSFDSAEATQAAREQLKGDPDVESVDFNFWMQPPERAETLPLNVGDALNLTPREPGDCNHPIIGLIDTAIQPTGGNLDAFLLPSISVASGARPSEAAPSHGTSMFETILRGLSAREKQSTTARILPVDVYGNSPTTTTFDVANGIAQAVKAGANTINLSLGSGGDSEFLHSVIKSAYDQGVLLLGAAGNEPGTAPTYPAAYSQVLAVTAGARDGGIASYANRGDFVDLAAPGSSIVFFNGQSWVVMGTSASTAYATGLAASMVDCNKRSTAQIADAMRALLPFKQ
jgi:hypothetical protein